MVVFFLYRLPGGEAAFQEGIERYRKDVPRKMVNLPDKQPFNRLVLEFDGVAQSWQRDCFAAGPRNLFQVYQSGGAGILVRWYSQRGTMLDHPLLGQVRDSVRLVEGQWHEEIPQTVQSDAAEFEDDEEDEFELVTSIDLREEKKRIRAYIEQRVAGYADQENFGPGEPTDPIGLITLGFYAEQTGYIALVFDTRPDAEVDGSWTTFIDDDLNVFYVTEWCGLYAAIVEEQTVTMTDHLGREHIIRDNEISDEDLNALFGEMLTALMHELRDDGTFAKLPLRPDAFLVIEEFDGRYFWPTYETRKTEGAIDG
ncbi:hypothetical protein [Stieleria maiorica]|nr:hypothetical protein [Stieleria maiorica]